MSRNTSSTDNIELVETANIARSLRRLERLRCSTDDARRRVLFHAVCMTYSFTEEERKNLRIALNIS